MKWFILLLFFSLTATARSFVPVKGRPAFTEQRFITDYPELLQKAGVKKIHCIFKDSRKFIWIGTENGLYRYDGSNIDRLEHDANKPHTIPHNNIVSITEDKHANIWIGTMQGAGRIDACMLLCTAYGKILHNLDDDFDVKIYTDHDGKIWAGSSTGLSYFDEKAHVFKSAWKNNIKGAANSGYINCLADWKNDTLLIGTFNGVVLLNKKNYRFRRIQPLTSKLTVTRLFVDESKGIWIGTWGDGCIVSDSLCKNFRQVKFEKAKNGELTNVITGIISTRSNKNFLWVSTSRGVYKITGFMGDSARRRVTEATSAKNGFINNIMADDEQYIWESGSLVSRFFAGPGFFEPLPLAINGSVADIQPVYTGGKTAIAISSWYNPSGLVVIDQQDWNILYRQKPQKSPDASNISGIIQDKQHRLWVSSLAGLQILNDKFRPVKAEDSLFKGRDKLSSQKTNAILLNHDTVWVACYKKGIDLYDMRFHKLKAFTPGDGSGLEDNLVERFFADSHGDVWLCGDYKFYKYDKQKGVFKAYNFNKDGTIFTTHDIAELPGGDLLIASGAGLFRFNAATGVYGRIISPLLARENDVPSVSVDKHGDIWYISNGRLVCYQLKNRHFTLFGQEDGLNGQDDLAWLKTFDGERFYLAEGSGIVAFSPGNQKNTAPPVTLYMHAIQVNDSTLKRCRLGNRLDLKYDENKINLEFGAVNCIKPEQNLYAYRLSGLDDNWAYTNHNYASYANLAPGSYTFYLKAENYAGLWSSVISMNIKIYPPFWGTWWFRLLSVVLITSTLLVAIRYVLQRNLREKILYLEKEKAIEQERNRIARDMHDDLGSGLTKIAVLSEVTKAQILNPQSATAYLDVISTASRELVDNLQDIIWVLNPQNDSVESLVLYMKEYAESFFEMTPASLQFIYDEGISNISLSEEKRRNIFLVVKECCNNILKHAYCTSVNITISIQRGLLLIEITDNGRGFETNETRIFQMACKI